MTTPSLTSLEQQVKELSEALRAILARVYAGETLYAFSREIDAAEAALAKVQQEKEKGE